MKKRKVAAGEEFLFRDGSTAETKAQLVTRLKKMDAATFQFHVNEEKHDVYNWLRDCLDSELAEKVRSIRDQRALIEALK